jgi:hypothetical protein
MGGRKRRRERESKQEMSKKCVWSVESRKEGMLSESQDHGGEL